VAEVTFDAARALAARKKVFYVTPVGVLRLTPRGLVLERMMPGIDVQRDVLGATPVPILLPPSGDVPVVADAIVTGTRRGAPRARRRSPRRPTLMRSAAATPRAGSAPRRDPGPRGPR
jgi:hypothetical protein